MQSNGQLHTDLLAELADTWHFDATLALMVLARAARHRNVIDIGILVGRQDGYFGDSRRMEV